MFIILNRSTISKNILHSNLNWLYKKLKKKFNYISLILQSQKFIYLYIRYKLIITFRKTFNFIKKKLPFKIFTYSNQIQILFEIPINFTKRKKKAISLFSQFQNFVYLFQTPIKLKPIDHVPSFVSQNDISSFTIPRLRYPFPANNRIQSFFETTSLQLPTSPHHKFQ